MPEKCKKCGGMPILRLQHLIGGTELFWYECTCCHKFPNVSRSAAKALIMWDTTQRGDVRPWMRKKWGTLF